MTDLPGGWRLADHKVNGRVIVTNTTQNRDGRVYYVLPSADPLGFDWLFCAPDELTYIDTPDAVPPNTLAVGSVWIGVDALTRACEESGRDQIVVSDFRGYVSVWSHDAEWWEGSAPPRTTPYTIIHTGRDTADATTDDQTEALTNEQRVLPVHRTEAGYPNCATCDGGGCPDCTDPA